ncbi:MAG: ATP-dependent Clp protease adaptor protein ClpS, partial [uncultured Nocardioides sp.]
VPRWRRVRSKPRRGRPDALPGRDHLPGQAVGDDRVERPGQPDVLRHLRLPEVLRLLRGEGPHADARGAQRRQVSGLDRVPRGDGARRAGDARVRSVGDDGEGEL